VRTKLNKETVRTPVSFITAAAPVRPRLYQIHQIAQYLGATNWFVEELMRDNKLPWIIVGKHRVVDVADLDKWIDAEKVRQRQFQVAA
jgi:excisionase family DNA binding protein